MARYLCTDFLVDCTPSPHDDMNSQDFSLVWDDKTFICYQNKKKEHLVDQPYMISEIGLP